MIDSLSPIVHFWLHHTVHCYVWILCYRKGGAEEGGWGHTQGVMHITADRLGYIEALVSTGWANSHWLHEWA